MLYNLIQLASYAGPNANCGEIVNNEEQDSAAKAAMDNLTLNDVRLLREFAFWVTTAGPSRFLGLNVVGMALHRLLAYYEEARVIIRGPIKTHPHSPAVAKERVKARLRSRSRAILGRVCAGCDRTDEETNWSGANGLCVACSVMRWRNGVCRCGSPLWKAGVYRGPFVCRAKCGRDDPPQEAPSGPQPVVYPTHWTEDEGDPTPGTANTVDTGAYHPTPGHIPHSPATPSAEPPETTGQHNATMPRVVSPTEGEADTA